MSRPARRTKDKRVLYYPPPDVQKLTLNHTEVRTKGTKFTDIFGYESVLLSGR